LSTYSSINFSIKIKIRKNNKAKTANSGSLKGQRSAELLLSADKYLELFACWALLFVLSNFERFLE